MSVTAASESAVCLCGASSWTTVFRYEAPPPGEAAFPFSASRRYRREVIRCRCCGHFRSIHDMDAGHLYHGEYISSTYRDEDGIRRAFERITALNPEQSDNAGRVQRVLEFAADHFNGRLGHGREPSVLDVGSGLCVFLHRMQAAGWRGTAVDPDPRAVRHAQQTVGVEAVCGDFMTLQGLGQFDVVTLNKVAEHVSDPIGLLARAHQHVQLHGFVYVEVPDGETASQEGPDREEFFIDHWHVFSMASLAVLAARAGFAVRSLERVRDPSGKYTLRGFLIPHATA